MKLADIPKGLRARKMVPFPGIIAPVEGQGEVVLDLIGLSSDEEAEALANARSFARSKGVDAPKPGEPEYDLGLMVHTLLLACKDHNSPVEAPAPFFASASEILQNLNREGIEYLSTLQELWQRELSPTKDGKLDEQRIWEIVIEASEEDDGRRFFEKWRPATLATCFHFTACRLRSLLLSKSLTSSGSDIASASAPRNELAH